ncbi:ADP-ribosylation factor protein 3 [Lecanora helva]
MGWAKDNSRVVCVPFAVRTPENYYVHLFSENHVRELSEAPEDKLSLHALSKDMFQPKYTMDGLAVEDRMSANGSLHSRVLRVVLRSCLGQLHDSLDRLISKTATQLFKAGKKTSDGWTEVSSFAWAKGIIAAANSHAFFGETLSSDPEFLKAALDYPEDLFKTAEVLRLVPSFLAPIIAPILMRQHRASRILVEHLTPVVEERLQKSHSSDISAHDKPIDCIQFFVDANSKKNTWSARKIIQVILGVWFAALHQPALSLTYLLDDLCNYPEYVELLREELETHDVTGDNLENLALLDSFLKESARLHPSDSISVRRKVLQPFSLTDGTSLQVGDVACVPLQAILQDPSNYPDSMRFDGFRFVDQTSDGNTERFTDATSTYPLWGLGKRGCPGRYFAARILKIVLAHILINYDIKMDEGSSNKTRTFSWRSAIVPKATSSLLFRKKCEIAQG